MARDFKKQKVDRQECAFQRDAKNPKYQPSSQTDRERDTKRGSSGSWWLPGNMSLSAIVPASSMVPTKRISRRSACVISFPLLPAFVSSNAWGMEKYMPLRWDYMLLLGIAARMSHAPGVQAVEREETNASGRVIRFDHSRIGNQTRGYVQNVIREWRKIHRKQKES